jgi:hypothetical protein
MTTDPDAWPWLKMLRENGLFMYMENNRLKCMGDPTPVEHQWIKDHKDEIISDLRKEARQRETK